MERSFWQQRWDEGRIGFHLSDVNPALLAHSAALAACRRVLVPLCGKTHDLWWLARQLPGREVVGVEWVAEAAAQLFAEGKVAAERSQEGPFEVWRGGGVSFYRGDVFALPEVVGVGRFDGLYDRAAMVALPPELRQRYAALLTGQVAPGGCGLLLGYEYEQRLMDGPPFAVLEPTVRQLLEPSWSVELLDRHDALASNSRFVGKVPRLDETVFRLLRR